MKSFVLLIVYTLSKEPVAFLETSMFCTSLAQCSKLLVIQEVHRHQLSLSEFCEASLLHKTDPVSMELDVLSYRLAYLTFSSYF